MARNSNRPIQISEGVTAELKGQILSFSGQKGSMDLVVNDQVKVEANSESILFNPKLETKESVALTGTMRALALNKMTGVSKGFERKLEINGVGYRVKINGSSLELSLGFSHPVIYELPEGVSAAAPTNTELVLNSIDKQPVSTKLICINQSFIRCQPLSELHFYRIHDSTGFTQNF